MNARRSGFTLIELVASAVLAAMMTAALFRVVWSTVRETHQLRQSETTRWPSGVLVEQMRRDFQNARGMLVTRSGVVLHGFLDHDRSTRSSTLRIGTAQYLTIDHHGRTILMRSVTGSGETLREPVWFGFGALQIEPLETNSEEDALLDDPASGGLPAVPGSFRVTMVADNGQTLWREVIHHHGG